MATGNADRSQPTWGSAIGLMVVSWILVILVCTVTTMLTCALVLGHAGSSNGGLAGFIASIVIGCLYRSGTVKTFGEGAGFAAVVGLSLGVLVTLVSMAMA